jgi:hypothetical protein
MLIKYRILIILFRHPFSNHQVKSKFCLLSIQNFSDNGELKEQLKKTKEIVNNHDKQLKEGKPNFEIILLMI